MKRVTLFWIVFACLGSLAAQSLTPLDFGYDKSGNRVSRVIRLAVRSMALAAPEAETPPLVESLLAHQITIYPNPTKGKLAVEITPFQTTDVVNATLFNSAGRSIATENGINSLLEFDLSHQPNGLYVLKITLNGVSTSWKIIKE